MMDMCTYGTITVLNSDVAIIYTSTHCSIVLNNRRQAIVQDRQNIHKRSRRNQNGKERNCSCFFKKVSSFKHLPLYNIMAVKPSKLKWHSFHLCHLTDWEVHDRNRIVNAWLAAVDVTSLRGRWRRVEWAYYSDSWLAAQEAVATSLLGLTSDNMSHWTGLLTCACGVGDL